MTSAGGRVPGPSGAPAGDMLYDLAGAQISTPGGPRIIHQSQRCAADVMR